jgi:hypothetical protein
MELDELTIEIDRVGRRPQEADDFHGFDQAGGGALIREAVGNDVLGFANAQSQPRAAVAHVVQRGEGLGDHRGVAADRVGDAGAEEDALGMGGDGAHERTRVEERVCRGLGRGLREDVRGPDARRIPVQEVVGKPDRVDARVF